MEDHEIADYQRRYDERWGNVSDEELVVITAVGNPPRSTSTAERAMQLLDARSVLATARASEAQARAAEEQAEAAQAQKALAEREVTLAEETHQMATETHELAEQTHSLADAQAKTARYIFWATAANVLFVLVSAMLLILTFVAQLNGWGGFGVLDIGEVGSVGE